LNPLQHSCLYGNPATFFGSLKILKLKLKLEKSNKKLASKQAKNKLKKKELRKKELPFNVNLNVFN